MSDPKQQDIDQLSINTLRFLAVDAVDKANSGHPGAPLGCAPIAYALFHKIMKYNPADPKWSDRDRFGALERPRLQRCSTACCTSLATTSRWSR